MWPLKPFIKFKKRLNWVFLNLTILSTPMGTSYTIIVAAFAAAVAVQGLQFWLSLVCARRLRMLG